ncbi:MAG: tRNA threonylcarbamoyladenosine dehydratase [Spirochaetaceae bacterium]|jgi:tRNA A37 threonylcarbamoyladenosine dehydratase|nr:tRNA threonylcarbamoyladenosine dehydratase [Spirochaetaceae bacterium]
MEQMIGVKALQSLGHKTLTLIGLGAVGGYVLEGLVRSGVGHLRLIDFDRVDLSNFNRQILAIEPNLNRLKTECAEERVKQINPDCQVEIHSVFLDQQNLVELLQHSGDLVVDAIDSFKSKAGLIEYCWRNEIPLLSSMGAARKGNPQAIERADLMDTQVCPLAKKLRGELRKRGVGLGVSVVYSRENPADFPAPPEVLEEGKRAPFGSFPAITGMFGLHLSQWAVEKLLND